MVEDCCGLVSTSAFQMHAANDGTLQTLAAEVREGLAGTSIYLVGMMGRSVFSPCSKTSERCCLNQVFGKVIMIEIAAAGAKA